MVKGLGYQVIICLITSKIRGVNEKPEPGRKSPAQAKF